MKTVSVLIKPASSLCNMRCRYCFYEDEAANRSQPSMGIMTPETGELLIREVFSAAEPGGMVSFAFQGGEPTVAGLDFFRRFVETAEGLNDKGLQLAWAIQTNGLAIDQQWAALFRAHHFLVGVSLDGDKALHDSFRMDGAQKGTWNRVTRAVALLLREGTDVNLLCVVTKQCARRAVAVYHALQKTGVRHLQFIPCLDPLETPRGSMPWSLTPKDYGAFLCTLFDAWYLDWKRGQYTSIRLFEDYVHLAMGLPAGTCATSGSCGAYFVVEADGSVYPCDFFVLDPWKLGRLGEAPLAQLGQNEVARRFLEEGLSHPPACAGCQWRQLCFGGCKRDWVAGPGGTRENYYCHAFQQFFTYAAPRILEIARAEQMAMGRG